METKAEKDKTMTTKPKPKTKPHKIGKGGNPRPAKHINPAVRPDDGRLAAVPTVSVSIRLPAPLLARLKDSGRKRRG
jgi:hypothetical protein